MPHAKLTDATIRALQSPASGQADYWDTTVGFKGFGIRVSQGGRKSFVLLAERRRMTLGAYPILSLSAARELAARTLARQTLDLDPEPPTMLFGDALNIYFESHCDVVNRTKTAYETKRLLNRHFKRKLERSRLADIRTSRIAELLDDIESLSVRRHAFAALRGFFAYTVRRGLLKVSPCDRLETPGGKAPSRERVLEDGELKAVWHAAEVIGYPFGTIVRLLILTGQRRSEIGGLRREWIKGDRVEFPAEVMKAKKPHTIALAPDAKAIIDAIPIKTGFLFPARRRGERKPGDRAFNGWSKGKAILERRIAPALPQWGLHDLRRTASTRWAELSVQPHINDMLLAHTMQGVSPVHRVYNLATHLEPMREALEKWETKLQALITDAPCGT